LQDIGRARIFGTPSPGAALPSRIEKLPSRDGFQYAFANYVSAKGQVLEGVGVKPDEIIRPDRATLLDGRDPVIDAAVAWIRTSREASASAGK
jgi:carboxyl-terminal processing protease